MVEVVIAGAAMTAFGKFLDRGVRSLTQEAVTAALADLAARLTRLNGTLFARVAIAAADPPRVLPERDGAVLKARFRAAIGV